MYKAHPILLVFLTLAGCTGKNDTGLAGEGEGEGDIGTDTWLVNAANCED